MDYAQFNVNEFKPSTLDASFSQNLSIGQVVRDISLMNRGVVKIQG